MNLLISIPVSDLSSIRDAIILAKNNALYNEKRCNELALDCSSETLAASLLHGRDLAHIEYLKYHRLLNLFSI